MAGPKDGFGLLSKSVTSLNVLSFAKLSFLQTNYANDISANY